MGSTTRKLVRGIGGGLLVAVALYLALAAPSLRSKRGDATLPASSMAGQ